MNPVADEEQGEMSTSDQPPTDTTVTPILKPDVALMLEQLKALFGRAMDGRIEITAIKATSEKLRPRFRYFDVDDLEAAAEWAAAVNSEHMWNVYVGAALRRPETFPGEVASDADFLRTYAVWADADSEAMLTAARAAYDRERLPPGMVVVTGRTPERRAQLWWLLESPISDIEVLRQTLRGITISLDTDRSVTTGKQLMRLAGSLAWPKESKPGRVLEPTELIRPAAALREVPLEHIQRAFPAPVMQSADHAPERGGTLAGALAAADLRSALASMRSDDRALWVAMGHALKELGDQGRGLWIEWSQTSEKYDPADAARVWDSFQPSRTGYQAVFAEAQRRGWVNPATRRRDDESFDPETGELVEADEDSQSEPFPASVLTGEPPERQWIVPEWIVEGAVNSLYGDGGVGKTLIAQQLACAVATGSKWLGMPVKRGSVLAVLCEDEKDELHRRHNYIKDAIGVPINSAYSDVWLWPRVGEPNIIVRWDRDGAPALGPLYERVVAKVEEIRPTLLILDTLADVYGGNEIDRPQVNYFIKTVLGGMIRKMAAEGHSLTILLLGHPSVAGKASGAGFSGSTAWNNAVRSRMYLTKPEEGSGDDRVLTRGKANYASSGDETAIRLFFANGVLHACDDAEDGDSILWAAKEEAIRLTDRAWASGRPYAGQKTHARYIYKALPEDMAASGFSGQIVRQALRELIVDDGEITLSKGRGKRGYRTSKETI